jgi:hypothetical protein
MNRQPICSDCIRGAPLSTLCDLCKDRSQQTHNECLDKWIRIESSTRFRTTLIWNNKRWLTNERRGWLQSFLQMRDDVLPSRKKMQEIYQHLARATMGRCTEEEYILFQDYNHIIGYFPPEEEEQQEMRLTEEDYREVARWLFEPEPRMPKPKSSIVIHVKEENIECPVCYEQVNNERCVTTQCHHVFCMYCIKHMIHNSQTEVRCPMCRTSIDTLQVNHEWVMDELQSIQ